MRVTTKGGGQKETIDPRLYPLLESNYQHAQSTIGSNPFTAYTGKLTPEVPQAVNSAISTTQGLTGYMPQQVAPTMAESPMAKAASSGVYGAPTGRDAKGMPAVSGMQGLQGLDSYMNPYLSQVADRTLSDLDRFRQMATNQNASDASLAGAWGGDRLGVENSLTNEAFAKQAAASLASLYAGGFDTGAGLLMNDKSNLLQNQQFNAGLKQQTNLANQQAGLTTNLANQQVGLQGQLANQEAGLQGAGLNLQAAGQLGQLGQQQYGMEQDALSAAYNEFLREQNYPYQQQQGLNSALGMFGASSGTQNYTLPMTPSQTMGGTVICTELERRGLVDAETLARADAYGLARPAVFCGYRLWATPIARRMRRSDRFARVVHKIAMPFIRKLILGGPDWTPIGVVLGIGVAICWALGMLTKPASTRQEA